MLIQKSEIKSECNWDNGLFIAKILQTDSMNLNPQNTNATVLQYGITAMFDDQLTLKFIHVDVLQGSKKEECLPVIQKLNQLIGTQVGKDFGLKIMQLSGETFCMHFEELLPQLASLIFRAKLIRIAHTHSNDEFLEAYSSAFRGKCLGWSK